MEPLIVDWIEEMTINGLADITIQVRARYMRGILARLPHPIKECSIQDIRRTMARYRKDHAQNTTRLAITYLILFMRHHEITGIEELKKMMPPTKTDTKKAGDMLQASDIVALIEGCRTSRDRAIIAVMYEGGMRPVEISRLRWEDVKFDESGVVINTSEKTGKPRYIRLINSEVALRNWQMDSHHHTGPVFHSFKGETPVCPCRINAIVREAAREAGITKRVYPYLLRHTRVTHLMEDGVPESVIKLQHWGSLNTPMLSTYAHISNQHIDQVLLNHAGVRKEEPKPRASPKPVQCPECHLVNLPGASYCTYCGEGLTDSARGWMRRLEDLAEDPDRLRRIADKIEQRRNEE